MVKRLERGIHQESERRTSGVGCGILISSNWYQRTVTDVKVYKRYKALSLLVTVWALPRLPSTSEG
jgi:hypothetical protein